MKINWKEVSKSPGYKSLKAAYIKDVIEAEEYRAKHGSSSRGKAEFLKRFNWVISRAKHYSHVQGIPLSQVLNKWEAGRDYWWFNYYQDCNQPKLLPRRPSWPSYEKLSFAEALSRSMGKHVTTVRGVSKRRLVVKIRNQKKVSKRQDNKARWAIERKNRQRYFKLLFVESSWEEREQFKKNKGISP
jgi:hypothetical protein